MKIVMQTETKTSNIRNRDRMQESWCFASSLDVRGSGCSRRGNLEKVLEDLTMLEDIEVSEFTQRIGLNMIDTHRVGQRCKQS